MTNFMPTHYLSEDTYICVTPCGSVWLDLKRDKYSGVPAMADRILFESVYGWTKQSTALGEQTVRASANGHALIKSLEAKGLLTRWEWRGKPFSRCLAASPSRSQLDISTATGVVQTGHLLYAALACIRVKASMRIVSIRFAVAEARRRKRRVLRSRSTVPVESVAELVCAFRRVQRLVYTNRSACLFDSFALFWFLTAYNVSPTLVIGVIPAPFAAHCWLQVGDEVVNDTLDHVERYEPILVI
jgi:hypothetical protein